MADANVLVADEEDEVLVDEVLDSAELELLLVVVLATVVEVASKEVVVGVSLEDEVVGATYSEVEEVVGATYSEVEEVVVGATYSELEELVVGATYSEVEELLVTADGVKEVVEMVYSLEVLVAEEEPVETTTLALSITTPV